MKVIACGLAFVLVIAGIYGIRAIRLSHANKSALRVGVAGHAARVEQSRRSAAFEANIIIQLPDGSWITFVEVRSAPDWAEGKLKWGRMRLPSGELGPDVQVYFKNGWIEAVWTVTPRVKIYP